MCIKPSGRRGIGLFIENRQGLVQKASPGNYFFATFPFVNSYRAMLGNHRAIMGKNKMIVIDTRSQ